MKYLSIAFSLLTLTAIAQKPVPPPISTPPPANQNQWSQQQLSEHFWAEGACGADINKDGIADVLCGPFWYEGPSFQKRHRIYDMGEKSFEKKKPDGTSEKIPGFEGFLSGKNAYSNNFVAAAHDFNSDGWMDYLVVGFPGVETFWFENPKASGEPWQRHLVLKVTDNESPMFADINGDKQPDLLCMSNGTLGYATYDPKNPTAEWKWHNVSGKPMGRFARFTHGIGHGDINSDGLADILEGEGWWEQPANWDGIKPWIKHDVRIGMGAQSFGYDVNGDGKTDIISCLNAHGWGIAWFEQTDDGGVPGWIRHIIVGGDQLKGETGVCFSQPHAMELADMNNDGVMDLITGKRVWAHGPGGDPEPTAWPVVWWFELKREAKKAQWIPHFISDQCGVGTQIAVSDMDGDKKPDVIVGNKRGAFVLKQK